jgi:oligopeptidase B
MPETADAAGPPKPPAAKRLPTSSTWHGQRLDDDYAWLRAPNWRDVLRSPGLLDPEIRAFLESENAYAEAILGRARPLQERLFAEMKGRIKEDDSSVPAADGPWAYATRYTTGAQHPIIIRAPRDGGADAILLDGNALAEGKTYFRFAGAGHSPDHGRLAYAFDEIGSEYFSIRFRDLETGADLSDCIEDTTGGFAWAAKGQSLIYIRRDRDHRPRWVYRHVPGTPQEDDLLVYEESDPAFFVSVGSTLSRRFIVIHIHGHDTSEAWLIDAEDPGHPPLLLAPRESGVEYDIEHWLGSLVIRTNADGAEDYKIVLAPLASPGRHAWRDLVPHEPGRLILDHVAFRDHLVWLERRDGLPRIVVRRWSDGAEHAIAFGEEAYSLGLSPGYEFGTTTLRFSYSSPATPSRVFDYDMESRERVLRKEQQVPSGHDPAAYQVRRVQAPAPDGDTVPVSLVHRRGLALDGSAPLFLVGYGAYGISIPAGFNPNVFSLVDRGFVYAIAHVRGGKDKGFRWYAQGRREHKVNTFTDFIAVAEHLMRLGFTSPNRIIAQGGSAGGLLMGAVANMRPDLFLGIIAEVPFVDVLNTMLDETLPLTPPEWAEWGNPVADPEAFARIRGYAPYDNVRAQHYPHMLVLAGLTDPRVTYWEPAKWVAKLRAHKTGDNLLLLKTQMGAGHGGSPGRFDRLKEVALSYAFALKIAGRGEAAAAPLHVPSRVAT